MSDDLTTFRDHCASMATAQHKPECATSCACRKSWCCGCRNHPHAKPWGWAHALWDDHDKTCPAERCLGCITDEDRALWTRLAQEVDDYLTPAAEEGLFA